MKLRKGDEVKIVRGKDKGKTGKIDKVYVSLKKVLISGINLYKRHKKARAQNQKSEIITITKPLSIENVRFICPRCHATARIGYMLEGSSKKRICKKCEQAI